MLIDTTQLYSHKNPINSKKNVHLIVIIAFLITVYP